MRVRKEEIERIVASDPAEHVRIVAAEALVGLGEPVDAVKLLARLADDDNALAIRMQAVDGLSNIGRAAIAALPVIRKAANAKLGRFVDPEYAKRMAMYLVATLEGHYDPAQEGLSSQACQNAAKSPNMFMVHPQARAGHPEAMPRSTGPCARETVFSMMAAGSIKIGMSRSVAPWPTA